ncbi:hypothetical protein FF38_10922 [Lucilia cuprina]|uniref:Uncharacterized protein n=1 Tax=Lucilia cuprina TaxID=7375 RepID=A0A0L0C3U3_LUCCU|nr:hypothetical protein CVS40_9557 [Lucilia cuprina]KNC26881.1 hypothetical protein FF38_10922 [Lucilia cuprina]
MENYPHPISPTTPPPQETVEKPEDAKKLPPQFQIENITVAKPPLLKIYYWESLDLENLNRKLLTDNSFIEHHLKLPTRQLNSTPLKIILWLRNMCNFDFTMRLKRIKNCQCVPRETRVGFNQFRHLYHCPHRRLIHISQDMYVMKPADLVAMSVVAYYYILGDHVLTFELRISDLRIILLHFHVTITTFDPVKSVLTTKMIPVDIKEHRSLAQPLWIRNITMQNLHFLFSGKNRGLRLINPNMEVPRQSVWPLIVEYRPSDYENNLNLFLNCGAKSASKGGAGNHFKIPITCQGYIQEEIEETQAPHSDYECADYLYVLYPNKLEFSTEINEEKTLMIAVHNYNQKCMQFKWQTYTISEYFSFTFEPNIFTLKPHHSKLCVVQVKSFNKPLHFKRIPCVLEIHRILDKSTQIAQSLLTEVESIDDPKWLENSYVEHVLLHIDLKVKFPSTEKEKVIDENDLNKDSTNNQTTIFEKLFWDYLSKSNYMRNTSKIPRNLNYEQVLNKDFNSMNKDSKAHNNKQAAFNILSFLTAEACRDLSKNYRFVPVEILDSI